MSDSTPKEIPMINVNDALEDFELQDDDVSPVYQDSENP